MDSFLLEPCSESGDILHDFQYNSELFPEFLPYGIPISNSNDQTFNILDAGVMSGDPYIASDNLAVNSGLSQDGWLDEIVALDDFSDDCLKFISEILMEEDLDGQTASLQDYTALQATEKSLLDAIGETYPSSSSSGEYPSLDDRNTDSPNEVLQHQSYNGYGSNHATDGDMVSAVPLHSNSLSCGSSDSFSEVVKGQVESPASTLLDSDFTESRYDWFKEAYKNAPNGGYDIKNLGVEDSRGTNFTTVVEIGSRGRKNASRYNASDHEEDRRNKHLAAYDDEYVEMGQFDDALLFSEDQDGYLSCDSKDKSSDRAQRGTRGSNKKKTRKGKKKSEEEGQVVDLRTLLIQCAQAVGSFDLRMANELLAKLRLHSSKYGDSPQRTAHYFANGLEARLAGTGWQKFKDEMSRRIPASDILTAYRAYVSAVPFRRVSYFVANDAITKLAKGATNIHIIDFGIFFGFQWPGLIQKLAKRKGGPPMLRITGIDIPERGFRPAKRVEETGRRLAGYCERFNVPFKYQAIAKNWEDVTIEELNIDSDEAVVVNCVYMSRKLLDETVDESNPRDTFFRLIRKLNPDLFIHGIVNGIYNGPFFETRFKEALFHYSSIFDMFEATIPRESNERLLAESHLYGTDALNVIACEGIERIERPETYRQWQSRNERSGFRKLVLEEEVVKRVQAAVKGNYHKDFVIYGTNGWLLQGWKGRILYAISCWRSA